MTFPAIEHFTPKNKNTGTIDQFWLLVLMGHCQQADSILILKVVRVRVKSILPAY